MALQDNLKNNDAIINLKHAIKLNPDYAEAYLNLAITLLLSGDFKQAWTFYDWRLKLSYKNKYPIDQHELTLANKSIEGKIVLITSEQGVGDEIMFCSMIDEVFSKCKKLIVEIDPRLIQLFERSFNSSIQFISSKKEYPDLVFDINIPMGSLPGFLEKESGLFNIRDKYLYETKKDIPSLRKIIEENKNKKICGVSWKSNNKKEGKKRSIQLNQLLPILQSESYIFIRDFPIEI